MGSYWAQRITIRLIFGVCNSILFDLFKYLWSWNLFCQKCLGGFFIVFVVIILQERKFHLNMWPKELSWVKYKISLCSCENKYLTFFLTKIYVFIFGMTSLFFKYFGLCKPLLYCKYFYSMKLEIHSHWSLFLSTRQPHFKDLFSFSPS